MERKLNIKVLLPEEVIEKYDIDEDTGVLSYFEDGAIHILIENEDEMPEEEMHDTVCDAPCEPPLLQTARHLHAGLTEVVYAESCDQYPLF